MPNIQDSRDLETPKKMMENLRADAGLMKVMVNSIMFTNSTSDVGKSKVKILESIIYNIILDAHQVLMEYKGGLP